MDFLEKSNFEVEGVSVELSPQFLELTDWLRGQDLFDRQLPESETKLGLGARRAAFKDLVNLYFLELKRQMEDAKAQGLHEFIVDGWTALDRACAVDTAMDNVRIHTPFTGYEPHLHLNDPCVEYVVSCPRCMFEFGV